MKIEERSTIFVGRFFSIRDVNYLTGNKRVLTMKTPMILKCFSVALLASLWVPSSYAQDDLTPGPGLFSGSDGQFKLLDTSGNKKEKKSEEKQSVEHAHQDCVPAETDTLTEFELFKEWRVFQSSDQAGYDEFKEWIEYRRYLENNRK